MEFDSEMENEWGLFKAEDSNGNLRLRTDYPDENRFGLSGYAINMNLESFYMLPGKSYDGIGLELQLDGQSRFMYLEIGRNQIEALRQHLNKWKDYEDMRNKIKEYKSRDRYELEVGERDYKLGILLDDTKKDYESLLAEFKHTGAMADDPSLEYVYLIASDEFDSVKIGMSFDVESRVKQIQTGCPYKVKLLDKMPSLFSRHIESELHEIFKDSRQSGEWFSLTREDIEYLEWFFISCQKVYEDYLLGIEEHKTMLDKIDSERQLNESLIIHIDINGRNYKGGYDVMTNADFEVIAPTEKSASRLASSKRFGVGINIESKDGKPIATKTLELRGNYEGMDRYLFDAINFETAEIIRMIEDRLPNTDMGELVGTVTVAA